MGGSYERQEDGRILPRIVTTPRGRFPLPIDLMLVNRSTGAALRVVFELGAAARRRSSAGRSAVAVSQAAEMGAPSIGDLWHHTVMQTLNDSSARQLFFTHKHLRLFASEEQTGWRALVY